MHKVRAYEVASNMYQDEALEQTELNEIQYKCSRNDIASTEYLLNIVMVRPPDVYQSFLRALQTTNQHDAYLLLTYDGLHKSFFFRFIVHIVYDKLDNKLNCHIDNVMHIGLLTLPLKRHGRSHMTPFITIKW